MKIYNRQILKTCPFEDYLKLPGNSYSGITAKKDAKFSPTKKMLLGSRVDQYLNDPLEYDYEQYELVKALAINLQKDLGKLIFHMDAQLVVTCDMEYAGLRMKYKGRADRALFGKIVVDFKVSEMPLQKAIDFFGYDKQLSGYCYGFDAQVGFIKSIHPKTKIITTRQINPSPDWWHDQILKKGEPV